MSNTGINVPNSNLRHITVVGAGINGLVTAYLLSAFPEVQVHIVDARSDPRVNRSEHNLSPTFGGKAGSNTVRHITGGESLVPPDGLSKTPAWLAARRNDPTSSCADKPEYKRLFSDTLISFTPGASPIYDNYHALFNYAGLELWQALADPQLVQSVLFRDGMNVYYEDEALCHEDIEGDTRRFIEGANFKKPHPQQAPEIDYLTPLVDSCFSIPGMAIDLRALSYDLMNMLGQKPNVRFTFDSVVMNKPKDCDVVVWAVNSLESQVDNERLTGLLGYWASIDNSRLGLDAPFKYALGAPMAFLNITPDRNNRVQISGGLFWNENFGRGADEVARAHRDEFLRGLKQHFLIDEVQKLTVDDISGCVRPCSEHGLPVLSLKGDEVDISGASKAGTTQAPVMALVVLDYLDLDPNKALNALWGNPSGLQLIQPALLGARAYARGHEFGSLVR